MGNEQITLTSLMEKQLLHAPFGGIWMMTPAVGPQPGVTFETVRAAICTLSAPKAWQNEQGLQAYAGNHSKATMTALHTEARSSTEADFEELLHIQGTFCGAVGHEGRLRDEAGAARGDVDNGAAAADRRAAAVALHRAQRVLQAPSIPGVCTRQSL